MKVGLWNLEPQYRNYAIEKLRRYYLDKKVVVEDCSPIESSKYDVVYCSSLFDWTSKKYVSQSMIAGGTGFNLIERLPDEIENTLPRLNYGFTTRGCIRHCPFCVVPEKEGNVRVVGDLLDLWDGKAKEIVLYDNNILALPEHFEFICNQAVKYGFSVDFNQGLDHRLLNQDNLNILKTIRHPELHFAFDHPNLLSSVEQAITLLQGNGIKRCSWYVLVGYDTTFEQDLERLNYLKSRGQNAFVQKYRGKKKLGHQYTQLARWANQHHIFQGMTWQEFNKAS